MNINKYKHSFLPYWLWGFKIKEAERRVHKYQKRQLYKQ